MKRHQSCSTYANRLLLLCSLLFSSFFVEQTAAQNANSFSSSLTYSGKYSYGANPGYYGTGWSAQNIAAIAMGSTSLGIKGAGVKSFRVPIYDDYLATHGLTGELADFQYYTSLGGAEFTAFIGSPSPAHQFDTTFSGSTEPSKVFKNLYEPVWLDAAKTQINPNNYFAKYLYDVVKTYGSYVKFWEVVNEPDFTYSSAGWSGDSNPAGSDSWFYHNPNASELVNLRAPIYYYVRELRVAWEVIKQLSPQSYICTGGIGYRSFLDALLRNTDNPVDGSVTSDYPLKAGAYFDVLSFHAYPQYALSSWSNALGQMVYTRHSDAAANAVINVQSNMTTVLNNYGYNGSQYPQKQFILTETGLSRVMDGTNWGTVDGQKNYLIKAQVAFQRSGIRQSYWYQVGDGSTTGQFDQMGLYFWFGNSTPYGQQSLSNEGIAMKTVSDQLYGKTYDAARSSMLNLPSNVDGGAFRAADGSYTYVLWAKTATDLSEVSAATYSFPATVVTASLNRVEWDYSQTAQASTVPGTNIQLTGSPSFFTGGVPAMAAYTTIPAKIEAENYAAMNGVQTEITADAGGGQDVGYIDPNDYMDYNITVPTAGVYTISFRIASTATNAAFQVRNSAGTVLATVTVPNTGGGQNWQTVTASVTLPAGQQTVRLFSNASGWNLNWLQFAAGTTATVPPTAVGSTMHIEAENYASMSGVLTENTSDTGGGKDVDYIDPNDWMDYSVNIPSTGTYALKLRVATPGSKAQLQIRKADGTILATVNLPNTGDFQAWQTVNATITLSAGQQTIRIVSTAPQYNNWNINWFELVSGAVSNPPPTLAPPIHIESENYANMSGVQTENTSDTGGGKDVDYIDPNDWMDYSLNIPAAGNYTVSFRIASPASNAQLQLRASNGTVLATVALPNTGAWQTWQTVTADVTLPAGQQTLRIVSTSPQYNGWNINWMEFAQTATVTPLSVSPNPTSGSFMLQVNNSYTGSMDVQILDATGTLSKDFPLTKDATGSLQTYLSISDLSSGKYSVKVVMSQWNSTIPITRQ